MIGASIGHYKILKKLGQGGMGIVYQAQDMTLDRLVALKFLPVHMLDNETERARFVQEAKSASSLNHPNVCIIHYIEKEADQEFIVMEYVDGVTLRDKFRKARLKFDEAMSYAIQIGEALQEAHSKNIVHRDIKSDNIMVNSKNQIKVMDFGLAKLKGSVKLTRSSSTVGTLAYMAPEQIQGGEADVRSDIFSYGVVVFEMLTQHTPFRGEHEAALVYSIVNEPPEPLERFRDDLSPELSRILHRALEKDPEDRYQSVADMVSELKRLKKETGKVSRASSTYATSRHQVVSGISPIEGTHRSRKTLWINLILVVLIITCGAVVYYLKFYPHGPVRHPVALNPSMKFRTLQLPVSELGFPGLSPDGNWVAFPAADAHNTWDVYYMNVTANEPRRVTNDSSISINQTDISPDGGNIVYDRWNPKTRRYEVCVVSALGGIVKRVSDAGYGPRWRPDGLRIGYFVGRSSANGQGKVLEFWSVQPDGNDKRHEFDEDVIPSQYLSTFAWAPTGTAVAFLKPFLEGYQEIFEHDLAQSSTRQLTMDGASIGDLAWSRSDFMIFSSERGGNANIWMMGSGDDSSVQVTKGSGPDVSMKISTDGRKMVYVQQQVAASIWLSDSTGLGSRRLSVGEHRAEHASLSPDGKMLALQLSDSDPLKTRSHIFVMNADGSGLRQLTSGNESAERPEWSPDGKWIAYVSREVSHAAGQSEICLVDPLLSEPPRQFMSGVGFRWMDSTHMVVDDATRSSMVALWGEEKEPVFEDSTHAFPLMNHQYMLFDDLRPGREGWWIVGTAPYPDSIAGPLVSDEDCDSVNLPVRPWRKQPLYLFPREQSFALCADGGCMVYANESGEIWKMSLPDFQRERFPGIVAGRNVRLNLSHDGKLLISAESHNNSKLVMIEDLQ